MICATTPEISRRLALPSSHQPQFDLLCPQSCASPGTDFIFFHVPQTQQAPARPWALAHSAVCWEPLSALLTRASVSTGLGPLLKCLLCDPLSTLCSPSLPLFSITPPSRFLSSFSQFCKCNYRCIDCCPLLLHPLSPAIIDARNGKDPHPCCSRSQGVVLGRPCGMNECLDG